MSNQAAPHHQTAGFDLQGFPLQGNTFEQINHTEHYQQNNQGSYPQQEQIANKSFANQVTSLQDDEDLRPATAAQPTYPGWPAEPDDLRTGRKWHGLVIFFDVLMVLLPLVFVAVAILAKVLDRHPVTDKSWGLNLIVFTRYVSPA
jgi:hypothetical protein